MSEERTARMSSVLGETGVVIGNVEGIGDLEIRGRVQGSISLNGRVLIAETGSVLGNVEATHIAVAGEVRGGLNAKDGVEVQAQGRVEGNVEAPRVGIEAGARVRGMLRTGGELPTPKGAQAVTTEKPTEIESPPRPRDNRSEASPPAQEQNARPLGERRSGAPPPRRDPDFTPGSSDRTRKLKPTRTSFKHRRYRPIKPAIL
jgi:cytoskeletal protein CcmA (bactofilin family)